MKDIVVSTLFDKPFVGNIEGIRLEPVEDTTKVKLVGWCGIHIVTLATYDDKAEAMGIFFSCQKVILDPTVNPVVLNFAPSPHPRTTEVPNDL